MNVTSPLANSSQPVNIHVTLDADPLARVEINKYDTPSALQLHNPYFCT